MVTLHLLKYLEDNGFGDIDKDLFLEMLPYDKDGIAIYSRGGERVYGRGHSVQNFDIYCAYKSTTVGYDKLEKIALFLSDDYDNLCMLPIIPGVSEREYKNARIVTIDNIENIGSDDNKRIVFRLSATIIYEREL